MEYYVFTGFEVNVLSYLIDIKTELSRLSAQVAAIAAGSDSGEDSGEEFQLPIATEEQLMEIELKLNERGARKILVNNIQFYLQFLLKCE